MAWIESHQEVAHHPKTRKLARRLEISTPTAVGHLHCLWHWALSFAPDGNLSKHDEEDVAIGAMWDGEPEALIEALVAAGYVDSSSNGLMLHDWQIYTGRLIERRKKDADRKAKARGQSAAEPPPPEEPDEDIHDESAGHPEDGARTVPTQPTQPNPPTSPTEPARGGDDDALREHFLGAGFEAVDVDAVVERISLRRFGEPLKDPAAWGVKVLTGMKQTRTTKTRPRVIELDDGTRMGFHEGQWRDLDEVNA